MKNTKLMTLMILTVFIIISLTGCYRFRRITPEEFIDAIDEVYENERKTELRVRNRGYQEAASGHYGDDGLSFSNDIYRIYDNSEDARLRFDEYCEVFIEVQESNPDSVEIVDLDDRGYIIFDDVVQLVGYEEYCIHEDGQFQSVIDEYFYDVRRFGCIYYYDNIVIVISSITHVSIDANNDHKIELLDALGLPHMLQEE